MFNKLKMYKIYKQFIKTNDAYLESAFRLKIDYVNFLYTIVNIDTEDSKKYYGENSKIATPFINEYIKKVEAFLLKNNMQELVAIRNIQRLDDLNWKIEFGFALFNTKKRAKFVISFLVASLLIFLGFLIF